jgi:hypothetical protein
MQEKNRVRERAKDGTYNYELNNMEGDYNFRRDPFREPGHDT